MIFSRKSPGNRRSETSETWSPRTTRLVQESWWLLVIAIIVYLALILATYDRADPGFSYTGTSTLVANRGGVFGAWLADMLLYLFGLSAWWWVVAGVVAIITSYRLLADATREREHPFMFVAIGFALVILASAAIEATRLWRMPAALPLAPGGVFGEVIGRSAPQPPLSLLEDAPAASEIVSAETLDYTSRLIERKLADFGVAVKVLAAYPGPVITRYEIEPAVGVKGAQIVNLVKDLARALSVISIRVVETIPGKSCMALELPNPKRP